jgi:N-acetylmuramoyl-L-alanine amidase
MSKRLIGIFLLRAEYLLLWVAIFVLAGSVNGSAQMSLPSPQDKFSFPSRKDFLWDGFNVVVLDPGHGGKDIGVVGPEGFREKDFTLNLARKIKRMLEDRLGLTVYLTREDDVAVSVEERTALSNYRNADLFISIHCAGGFARQPPGAVVCFYLEDNPATIPKPAPAPADSLLSWRWNLVHRSHLLESAEFAKIVAGKVGPLFKGEARGVPDGMIQVLQGAAMPAILMEVGSMTALSDEAILRREDTLTALAGAIVEAVQLFKSRVEGTTLPPSDQ